MHFALLVALLGSAAGLQPALRGGRLTAHRRSQPLRPVPPLRPVLVPVKRRAAAFCAAPADAAVPPPPLPTREQLRQFVLPCLALWLSGPLLSLVDTAAVGLSAAAGCGATQLAALGPATTFCDGATYLFAFLNVATTNLYATAAAGGRDDEAEAVVRRASKVALTCGAFLTLLVLRCGRPLLGLYVGAEAAANEALLGPATAYVRIRALSLPTALLGGVLQAALLGAKDSLTPLLAIGFSTVANVLLDGVLVCAMGKGLVGAAVATLAAQLIGTAALLRSARRKLLPRGGFALLPPLPGRLRSGAAAAEPKPRPASVSVGRFLAFAAPVLTLIVGKLAAFGFMTHAAAGLGDLSLAAHQLVLTTFFFLSPFLEVLSQTAQTFLPEYAAPPADADRAAWFEAADSLAARILRYAYVAAFAAVCGGSVPLFGSRFLTNDASVRAAVRPLALPLAVGALLTGPVCAGEGVLLARRQLGFLAGVYLSTVALLPPALLAVKRAGGPVVRVWAIFAAFQAFRAALFTARIWGGAWLRRRRSDGA